VGISNWRRAVKMAFVVLLLRVPYANGCTFRKELVYFLKDIILAGAYLKFFFAPDPDLRAYRLRVSVMPVMVLTTLVAFVRPQSQHRRCHSGRVRDQGLRILHPLAFMIPYLFRSEQDMINNFEMVCPA